ncbi:MAG: HAMP domain-containing histidine kinase, partial [Flavobacteriaceae bacterium]|nr:HAMP domain-containing histidine kinase [Flavobacteriaceae bacterium]
EYFNSYLYTLYSNTAIFEGDYKLALEYELQSLYYAEKADDAYRIAICRHNLSDIYYFLGDLGKALEECKLIESQIELIGDERVAAEFQKRLGNIYFQMHDLVKSRQAFENAYTIYDKVIDNLGKAKTILEMTPLLIAEGSFDKAEEQLKTSIFGLIELGDSVLLMKSHKALGDLWQNQELFEKARHEYLSTYSYFQQNGFLEESAQICISLVESYNSSGNPDSALWYADKGLEFYLEAGSKKGLADIYEIRYKLFRETGDLAQALHNHELFYAYTDSIKTEDAQRRFMEESVRQNVENIEKEKELVEIQNQLLFSRNRLYLILGGLLILVAGLLLWSYRNIRRSKNRIARQNLELEEMNQTKDRFFSIIAHDLRSPIVGLQGVGMQMAYYLEKNKPEELANVTRLVDETTTRLNQLLDNLLSWALSQTNSFPFSADWNPVRLMIEDTVKIFTPLAEAKNLQFKINTPSELQVFGDDRALRTVFRNLISNAVKFSKKDGQVIITARMVRQQLEVAVQDSGIGLPAEKLEELYSLKKMIQKGSSGEPGTGLGLVLCQYLMELHQGKIWAESEEGKGATFIISLPQPALIPSVETIKKEDKLVSV